MYNQIDRLKEGDERACDKCGKIYEAIYFPYKSVNYCISCYEIEHGVVLHKHRKKINRKRTVKKIPKFERFKTKYRVCPICQAESLTIDRSGAKVCKNCNKTAKLHQKLKTKIKEDRFQRENTLEKIMSYLKSQKIKRKPIQFWYRDDIKPRIIHDYYLDEKYINVRSDKGYFIKFLIDKIRKI